MTPEERRARFRLITPPRVLRDRYLHGFGHAWACIAEAWSSGGRRFAMEEVRRWLARPFPEQVSQEEGATLEGFLDGVTSVYE